MTLLLGIDGGGTSTRALLAAADGTVLGVGLAGPSNYQAIGFEAATAAILNAVRAAFQQADLSPVPVHAICLGLAGVGRPEDAALFSAWAVDARLAQLTRVVNDAELVLAAGAIDGWGLALIAGTGSICLGMGPDGRRVRVGGWGYILGDQGSGYDLAVRALRLATLTADGRATAHGLLALALEHWGLREPTELIHQVYRTGLAREGIAALSRHILALAASGDAAALTLRAAVAADLAALVDATAAQLAATRPPLALAGGLTGDPGLRADLSAALTVPLHSIERIKEPARGALKIAQTLVE
jgi:N-acetylglucosamine kinase-like BadF-type ATPase